MEDALGPGAHRVELHDEVGIFLHFVGPAGDAGEAGQLLPGLDARGQGLGGVSGKNLQRELAIGGAPGLQLGHR